MRIKQGGFLCCILLLLSLSLAHAQGNAPSPFGNLEVIAPDNLDRLVKLRDLDRVYTFGFAEMSFNANSTLLAGGAEGGVWIWNLATGRATEVVKPYGDFVYTPAVFSPTDPNLLATCNTMWDVSKLERVFEGDFCSALAFDPSGRSFATAHPLRLLDAYTGSLIRNLPQGNEWGADTEADGHIVFSPDGTKLAYCGTFNFTAVNETVPIVALNVINLADEQVQTVPDLPGTDSPREGSCPYPTDSLYFSRDGRYLYSNIDFGITVFDSVTSTVDFSPDPWGGRLIPSPDRQIMFDFIVDWQNKKSSLEAYDLTTLHPLTMPPDLLDANVDISPDGKLLAAYTNEISIWGVPSS